MNKKNFLTTAFVLAAVVAGGAFSALADDNNSKAADKAEMQTALSAKVPMSAAIKAAEAKSGGKAMEAVFSDENGRPGYEVTLVAKDGSEQNLFVDAGTGEAAKATSAAENENDDNGATDDSAEGE